MASSAADLSATIDCFARALSLPTGARLGCDGFRRRARTKVPGNAFSCGVGHRLRHRRTLVLDRLAVQIHDLKRKAIRGGLAKLLGQGANFALRLGFIVTLARFLDPADFGLVAMVTAVTGILPIFTSTGLSSAAVRQEHVTDEQMSGLFWFNILAGAALGILSVAIAPLLCYFYQEPRLFWIMVATSAGLVISAAGVQHNTLLQRHLRYDELTAIEVLSQLLGIAVGISMAISGFAYWALV